MHYIKRLISNTIFLSCLCFTTISAYADTMEHYMNIAGNIPLMELKADPESQAWARSARNILILTSESIMETLNLANESAKKNGAAMFCLKDNNNLTGTQMNDLIQLTFKELSSKESDKNNMTVSQLALLGLSKQYPCRVQTGATNLN